MFGIPASVWLIVAVVALLAGGALLLFDRTRTRSAAPDRREWAEQRGWDYADADPVLPDRWHFGTIQQGGPGAARRLVSGVVATPQGHRQVYVFDHEQDGRVGAVLAAVQTHDPMPGALELRLPSARLPTGPGLELLDEVGRRYAFGTDAKAVGDLVTPELAQAADAVGDDVELIWAEDHWVLAAAPVDADPLRLQDLLADLIDVATALERGQHATPRHGRS